MTAKRFVEVFTAGCPLCDDAVKLVQSIAGDRCEVQVWDLREGFDTNECREKVQQYGIQRVPAIVVDGKLAQCCSNQQPITREALEAAGIGQG
jgi:glutaredoxin